MSLLVNNFYRFGGFIIDPDQRILLRDGKPLPLAPKVFDTLLILVENNRRIVGKDELMARLWPDTFVEEANLTYSIQQLRKLLGDNARNPIYVETIPRRGYRFIANVEEMSGDKGMMSDGLAQRFETPAVQSQGSAGHLNSHIVAQGAEPAINLANQSQPVMPEAHIAAPSASGQNSIRASKRTIAVAAASVIVLACVGLLYWKLASNNKRIDGKSTLSVPLKMEKLTGTGQSRLVAISPDSRFLAYTQTIKKESGIWLRQLATNTNIEIVPPTDSVYSLAFSNSGEYLYFVKGVPTALHRVSSVGGVPTKIVDKPEGKFSISSDDSQIVFIRKIINRDGQIEHSLIIAGADGTDERRVFGATYPDKLDVPVWSPDGQAIFCAYGNETIGLDMRVVEIRVADGTKKDLSADRFTRITKMAWLPDRSGLIMSARQLSESSQLWRISYPSVEISQITQGLYSYLDLSIAAGSDKAAASQATRVSDIWIGSGHEPRNLKKLTQAIDNFCWTPSGRLVYSSMASGNRNLWIMEPDGKEQRQLTNGAAVDGTPAVTPDGRYIIFMSNRTGSYQVWRMNSDGSNQIQLTSGVAKNFPSVSPDGKWVLYNTTDDWHLWKVSIDGGYPLRLTEHTAQFASVSPDGKMIACYGLTETYRKPSVMILPFEGGQPLKRFEFAGGRIRGYRLQWTADGKALIYGFERDGITALIKQSLDGGPPEEMVTFDEADLLDFGYSFNGQFLAVTQGNWQHDVVLISDLNWH